MKKLSRDTLRLRSRWLYVNQKNLKFLPSQPIPLPFSCGYNIKDYEVYADQREDILHLFAVPNNEFDKQKSIQIYPPYCQQDSINHESIGNIELKIWVVNSERDRQIAQSIISRTHYLSSTTRGLFVGCHIVDKDKELVIRELTKNRKLNNTYDSPAWTNPLGRMIGCAVLDKLMFGNPLGRDEFADNELGSQWRERIKQKKLTRKEVVDQLGLVWASRFAVDEPYIGLRANGFDRSIGTVIACHLQEIAANYYLPPARRIEVIRTVKKKRAEELTKTTEPKSDFLTLAGYKIVRNHVYSRPLSIPGSEGFSYPADPKDKNRITYRKVYYYFEL